MESNTNITVTTTEVDQGGPSFKRPLPLSERDCNTQKIIRLEDITLLAAPQEEHIQHDVEVSDIFKPSAHKSITMVARKKNMSPKTLALYKESRKWKQEASRLKRRNASIKQRLSEAKKLIFNVNGNRLFRKMSSFQRRFFQNQFRNIEKSAKGKRFDLDTKLDSLMLWKSSPTTYKNLNRLGFSLPTPRTLNKLLSKIPIQMGISESIFTSITNMSKNMKNKDKYCNLIFDEMSLQPHLDYNYNLDMVVGFTKNLNVADHVTVFMLRGVFSKWKQPVAYIFNKSAMPAAEIVFYIKIITEKVISAGLTLVGLICDQGPNNVKAISLLREETRMQKISNNENWDDTVLYIKDRPVLPLFDPPHLVKSTRNNFLNKNLSFTLNNKKMLGSWSHIIKAYNIDKSNNIRVMRKITDQHIYKDKMRKMKVSIAAQIFSATVASAIKYCAISGIKSADGASELDASALDTAELLIFFDNLFDSTNGSFGQSSAGKPLRGFVSDKSAHVRFWRSAVNVLETMEFIKSKPTDRSKPPVLNGWIKTIRGFIQINRILMVHGFKAFAPRMFNQDPLENFFCQIRQYGIRNTNPTCAAFASFYKALIVKNIRYHPQTANCEDDMSHCLSTLREMLHSNKDNQEIQVPDRWHPPEVTLQDVTQIEKATLSYISGFICNHLFKKITGCDICKLNLLHNNADIDEFHHKLVSIKEYDPFVKKLVYANVDLIKNIIKIYEMLQSYVPSAIDKTNIRVRIISVLRCKINFNFEECPHREEIETFIFSHFVKIYIYNYVKKLNNILMGKLNPDSKNILEMNCFEAYRRMKHLKNK